MGRKLPGDVGGVGRGSERQKQDIQLPKVVIHSSFNPWKKESEINDQVH